MKRSLSDKTVKFLKIITFVFFVLFLACITYFIGRPMIQLAEDPDRFRAWIDAYGFFGMIVFVGMVFLQVIIALIPGEPIELVAGYAFGPIAGTLLCMIGMFLGSIVVFLVVRRYGIKIVEVFFDGSKLLKLNFLKYSKKRNALMFIIFLIPGTPKDLLCYFAGLTDIKLSTFIFISSIARLPSVITSTVSGGAFGMQSYLLAIIILAITLFISLIGMYIYKLICDKNNKITK